MFCRPRRLRMVRIGIFVVFSLLPAAAALSANYPRAAEPAVKPAFLPLPPGAVEPAGWLRDWAVAVREGITGHLDEYDVSFREAWKGPIKAYGEKDDGTSVIEQCSYWLDGALRLGFVLHDEALIRKILRPARPGRGRREEGRFRHVADLLEKRLQAQR